MDIYKLIQDAKKRQIIRNTINLGKTQPQQYRKNIKKEITKAKNIRIKKVSNIGKKILKGKKQIRKPQIYYEERVNPLEELLIQARYEGLRKGRQEGEEHGFKAAYEYHEMRLQKDLERVKQMMEKEIMEKERAKQKPKEKEPEPIIREFEDITPKEKKARQQRVNPIVEHIKKSKTFKNNKAKLEPQIDYIAYLYSTGKITNKKTVSNIFEDLASKNRKVNKITGEIIDYTTLQIPEDKKLTLETLPDFIQVKPSEDYNYFKNLNISYPIKDIKPPQFPIPTKEEKEAEEFFEKEEKRLERELKKNPELQIAEKKYEIEQKKKEIQKLEKKL